MDYAISLALNGGEIVLIYVIHNGDYEEILKEEISRIPRIIKVTLCIEFGDPSDKILETAENFRVDLIVIGIKGNSLDKEIGSISDKILEKSKIPVMVIR